MVQHEVTWTQSVGLIRHFTWTRRRVNKLVHLTSNQSSNLTFCFAFSSSSGGSSNGGGGGFGGRGGGSRGNWLPKKLFESIYFLNWINKE